MYLQSIMRIREYIAYMECLGQQQEHLIRSIWIRTTHSVVQHQGARGDRRVPTPCPGVLDDGACALFTHPAGSQACLGQ